MKFTTFFHYISYLQYPLMLVALFFSFRPYFLGLENLAANPSLIFQDLNSVLLFMGLGMSFSSLQDTKKTQNNFSKKIWQSPKKGKIAIVMICLFIACTLLFGVIGYYFAPNGAIKDLSIGTIVLALGMFGILKAAVEMFEHHRKDKNPSTNP